MTEVVEEQPRFTGLVAVTVPAVLRNPTQVPGELLGRLGGVSEVVRGHTDAPITFRLRDDAASRPLMAVQSSTSAAFVVRIRRQRQTTTLVPPQVHFVGWISSHWTFESLSDLQLVPNKRARLEPTEPVKKCMERVEAEPSLGRPPIFIHQGHKGQEPPGGTMPGCSTE